MIGRTVADRFIVQARIGSGGMGTVYKAVQTGLNRPVALKLLKEEVSWDPDTITRFHREAKAMSLLVHPNTVRVFDFGQTREGILYLAMELLEGELLTQKLEREGALAPDEAIGVGGQILASLHEAHAKGIIHRDLKPDNIYLADVEGHSEPVVKVLDFGIAKVFEGENQFDQLETQAGTVFGTPRYMSPEQAQGKSMDARSDLYSVGVLVYQLLTGVAPFRDEDAVVVMAKHIRDKPVPPAKAAPTRRIPLSLSRTVMRALEKSPEKRYQDADAFHTALEACLPEAAGASGRAQTGIFWRAQSAAGGRGLWIAAGVLLVLMLAGVLAFAFGGEDEPEPVAEAPTPSARVDAMELEVEAEEPPRIGTAELDSDPTGARVYHQGRFLGETPLRHDMPEAESMTVEVRRAGYETVEAVLTPTEPRLVLLHRTEPETTPMRASRMTPQVSAMRPTMQAAPTMEPSAMEEEPHYTRFR